jgi:phosphoribosylformylglycinamidine synthase
MAGATTMVKPKVLILRTAGTNCDKETAFAFDFAGGESEFVHINELVAKKKKMKDYQILAIPGGFTYGDDIASGKLLANELKFKLAEDIGRFICDSKLIIGICNGFQVLVKSGLLPGTTENRDLGFENRIQATLALNNSAKFEDRWAYLKKPETRSQKPDKCVWTINTSELIYLPVAHGEGKFIPKNEGIRQRLWNNGQVVLQYTDEFGKLAGYPSNPNGSIDNIAGICDSTGRIFGLMPHPERHAFRRQHPRWTDKKQNGFTIEGDGMRIFKNAIDYAKNNL